MRNIILSTISDLVESLLHDDRKDDEDLPIGIIENMVRAEEILITEMVDRFEKSLREGLKDVDKL